MRLVNRQQPYYISSEYFVERVGTLCVFVVTNILLTPPLKYAVTP